MPAEKSPKSDATTEGPVQISSRVTIMDITGYLMPALEGNQPVLVGMPGTDDLFIMLFSDVEKLIKTMMEFDLHFDRIKEVMNGPEFLDSIREDIRKGGRSYELRVAVDAYKHENGRIRFTEIFLEAMDN